MSVSKGPGIHCGGRCPYGTPAARNFPAHRRHTVEVERKDMADVLPQGHRAGGTVPSIALRIEGLWARDKPDYHASRAGPRRSSSIRIRGSGDVLWQIAAPQGYDACDVKRTELGQLDCGVCAKPPASGQSDDAYVWDSDDYTFAAAVLGRLRVAYGAVGRAGIVFSRMDVTVCRACV